MSWLKNPQPELITKNQVQQRLRRPNSNFQNCADYTVEDRKVFYYNEEPPYPRKGRWNPGSPRLDLDPQTHNETRVWEGNQEDRRKPEKEEQELPQSCDKHSLKGTPSKANHSCDSETPFPLPLGGVGETEKGGAAGSRRKAKPPDKCLTYQKTRESACAKWECASKGMHSPNSVKLMVRLKQKPRSEKKWVEGYQKFPGGQPTKNWL